VVSLGTYVKALFHRWHPRRHWAPNTLVVGPAEPVDGDSVACTKALINYLRSCGRTAYTLPVLCMHDQINWVLEQADLHPATWTLSTPRLTTPDLQAAYDAMLREWQPDEIVIVDGAPERLGFDPRGVSVFCIDHHVKAADQEQDTDRAYVKAAPSAGCLLIEHFHIFDPVLVVSILTDTYWLRQNRPAQALDALALLRANDSLSDEQLEDIQRKLSPTKDPVILLAARLCDLRTSGKAAFVVLDSDDPQLHREIVALISYYWRNSCVVRGDGYVSFRSQMKDLRPLAAKYNGGGHEHLAAGRLAEVSAEAVDTLCRDFMGVVENYNVDAEDLSPAPGFHVPGNCLCPHACRR
jgi:nanoRNase/pAp phosphatase (c-di-AMP/oligoRNAs hydrolase)